MNNSKTFGQRFKKLRLEKGYTQKELIEEFNSIYHYNFGKSAVSQYENDRRIPEIESLQDFASYFNVTIDYLLGRTDIRNPYDNDPNMLPDEFTSAEDAMAFILKQQVILDYGGYSLDDMEEEELLDLANDLLFAMRFSLEQKKKNK